MEYSDQEEFEQELEKLLRLHKISVYACVDAGACQTEYDYRNASKAEERFNDFYESFLSAWSIRKRENSNTSPGNHG